MSNTLQSLGQAYVGLSELKNRGWDYNKNLTKLSYKHVANCKQKTEVAIVQQFYMCNTTEMSMN